MAREHGVIYCLCRIDSDCLSVARRVSFLLEIYIKTIDENTTVVKTL